MELGLFEQWGFRRQEIMAGGPRVYVLRRSRME